MKQIAEIGTKKALEASGSCNIYAHVQDCCCGEYEDGFVAGYEYLLPLLKMAKVMINARGGMTAQEKRDLTFEIEAAIKKATE
jgi:hypothetical protein